MEVEARTVMMPKQWGKDILTTFIDDARNNQFGTLDACPDHWARLTEIDAVFFKAATNADNPEHPMAPLFLFRAHSAFRAAVMLATAGQINEAIILCRAVLEFSSYGLLITTTEDAHIVWLSRHDGAAAMKKHKDLFTQTNLRNAIEAKDKKLSAIYQELYQLSIDFGAHPNERSVSGSMEMRKGDDGDVFLKQLYLHGDDLALKHGMIFVARVGLCSLFIFAQVFGLRFMLLGLSERIQKLRQGL
jgi:hypothetical protein